MLFTDCGMVVVPGSHLLKHWRNNCGETWCSILLGEAASHHFSWRKKHCLLEGIVRMIFGQAKMPLRTVFHWLKSCPAYITTKIHATLMPENVRFKHTQKVLLIDRFQNELMLLEMGHGVVVYAKSSIFCPAFVSPVNTRSLITPTLVWKPSRTSQQNRSRSTSLASATSTQPVGVMWSIGNSGQRG